MSMNMNGNGKEAERPTAIPFPSGPAMPHPYTNAGFTSATQGYGGPVSSHPTYTYRPSATQLKKTSTSGKGVKKDKSENEMRRAHHNALERKRRDHIKDSFTLLKDTIPALMQEKNASRALVLTKSTEYIKFMKQRNVSHKKELDDIEKQNAKLEAQVLMFSKRHGTLPAEGGDKGTM